MATLRSQPNDDNHLPARSDIPAASQNADSPNTEGQEAERSNAVKEEELTTQPVPDSARDSAPPLAQLLFDRLNQTLDDDPSQTAARPLHQALHELGELIRYWRLQHNYTRPQLAAQLAMEADLLLCLERGIAQPQDISEKQLHTLAALLQDDKMDPRLMQYIKDYLATLR